MKQNISIAEIYWHTSKLVATIDISSKKIRCYKSLKDIISFNHIEIHDQLLEHV